MSQIHASCPELLFLRACCGRNITPAELSRLLEYPSFDWEALWSRAEKEQLSCLLYKVIKGLPEISPRIPAVVYTRLTNAYYQAAARAVEYCRQFESVAAHLQAHGLEFVLLKGLALSEGIYHDVGIRSSCDFDILVREEDIVRADHLLREQGFRLPFALDGFGTISVNAYRNSLLYLGNTRATVPVHLYWHLINTVGMDTQVTRFFSMDALRKEAVWLQIGTMRVRTLCPHHQIIYLCLHAFTHSFGPSLLLCDIHELIRTTQDPLLWDTLVKDARRFGVSRYVGYALEILARTFGTEVPPGILAQLIPGKMPLYSAGNIERVIGGTEVSVEEWMFAEALHKSPGKALIYFWQAVFPDPRSLALLKQKPLAQVCALDYLRRIIAALRGASQAVVTRYSLKRKS